MSQKIKCVKGVRDILPPEVDVWNFVEGVWKKYFSLYGFKEIRIPIFEYTGVFQRGIGEGTDIVEKEMYTFLDKSKNSITLRPEGTASVVRAYIEHNLYMESPFNKFFYSGPMFRYERPQKGRYRQFYQMGVEVFDDDSSEVEVEVIEMIVEALKEMGFNDYQLNINSIGCKNCRPKFIEVLREKLKGSMDRLCEDCKRRIDLNPLRVLDCKKDSCRRVVSEMPVITEFLCDGCREHHHRFKELLVNRKISFVENPLLVRGLDYYVRTTFEVLVGNLGAQNAILGGGRYDGLVKELGGPDVSGFGFALGVDRMVLALKEDVREKSYDYPEFYLAFLGEDVIPYSFEIMNLVRKNGHSLYTNFRGRSLKSHMRLANKLNVKYVVIIGENEVKKGCALLKNMENGSQREINISDFENFLVNYN